MDTITIPMKLESARIIDQLAKNGISCICPIFNLHKNLGDKLPAIINKAVSTVSETTIVITRKFRLF